MPWSSNPAAPVRRYGTGWFNTPPSPRPLPRGWTVLHASTVAQSSPAAVTIGLTASGAVGVARQSVSSGVTIGLVAGNGVLGTVGQATTATSVSLTAAGGANTRATATAITVGLTADGTLGFFNSTNPTIIVVLESAGDLIPPLNVLSPLRIPNKYVGPMALRYLFNRPTVYAQDFSFSGPATDTPIAAGLTVTGGWAGSISSAGFPYSLPFVFTPEAVTVGLTAAGALGFTGQATTVVTATVTATSFILFSEENTARTNQAFPAGATDCRVTLIGGGAGAGTGLINSGSVIKPGGRGGGGGAYLQSSWIPISTLGATYTMVRGATANGGSTASANPGAAGNFSRFTSGTVTLTANGGAAGTGGINNTTRIAGGTATIAGSIPAGSVTETGGQGGASSDASAVNIAGTNTTKAGAGGGGGFSQTAAGNTGPGGKGGDSAVATGPAGGANLADGANSPGTTAGNGGAGGSGGGGSNAGSTPMRIGGDGMGYGSGGGGAGGAFFARSSPPGGRCGGDGGPGYTLIEFR